MSLPATMSSVFRQRGSSTDSTTAFSAGWIAQGKGRVVVVVSGYDSAAVYRVTRPIPTSPASAMASFWLTEHHFQPKGAEMSPNPLMVQMSVAAHTKRIRPPRCHCRPGSTWMRRGRRSRRMPPRTLSLHAI